MLAGKVNGDTFIVQPGDRSALREPAKIPRRSRRKPSGRTFPNEDFKSVVIGRLEIRVAMQMGQRTSQMGQRWPREPHADMSSGDAEIVLSFAQLICRAVEPAHGLFKKAFEVGRLNVGCAIHRKVHLLVLQLTGDASSVAIR